MSKTLRQIVKDLQYLKDWTIEDVAKSIGYSRVHLTKEMKKENNVELAELLYETHKEILQNDSSSRPENIVVPLGDLKITLKDHFDLMKEHTEYVKKHAALMERIIEARLLAPEEINSDGSRKSNRRPPGAQGGRRFQE